MSTYTFEELSTRIHEENNYSFYYSGGFESDITGLQNTYDTGTYFNYYEKLLREYYTKLYNFGLAAKIPTPYGGSLRPTSLSGLSNLNYVYYSGVPVIVSGEYLYY